MPYHSRLPASSAEWHRVPACTGNMPGAIKYLTQLLAAMDAICGYPTIEVPSIALPSSCLLI